MILADKIIQLRKKNNWSQEEFAMHMKVSRQAVSKWEQAQSIPDLDKILLMASIFGVSTDYLLKDEIEIEEYVDDESSDYKVRRISLDEANQFLTIKSSISKWVALAIALFIVSPVPLLILDNMAALNYINNPSKASSLGVILIFMFVAIGVAILLLMKSKTEPFVYLQKEVFELQYGVESMVKQKQAQFQSQRVRYNMVGVILCILAVVPILMVQLLANEAYQFIGVSMTLLMIGIGVFSFVYVGTIHGSLQQLLQEGDYTPLKKKRSSIVGAIAGVYWLSTTALYLYLSFSRQAWEKTWVIWPVAGVLCGAIMIITEVFADKKHS